MTYHMCPECEASFRASDLQNGLPPHHLFNQKPCPGGANSYAPFADHKETITRDRALDRWKEGK